METREFAATVREVHSMELITPAQIDSREVRKTFRYRPGAAFIMFLMSLFPIPLVVYCIRTPYPPWIAELPWWGWVLASPIIGMSALLWLLVVTTLGSACSACFRSGNWLMKVTHGGVYLKFRSYLNYHFPEDGQTVVYVRFAEMESAQKTYEAVDRPDSEGTMQRTVMRYLDLHLESTDTDQVKKVIVAEITRQPPKGRISSSRFHHVPVRVAEPGVLRVDWRGNAMLRALRPYITIQPPRRIGVGYEIKQEDLDEQIAALLERGELLAATKMARDGYKLPLKDARDVVRTLSDRMAGEVKEAAQR